MLKHDYMLVSRKQPVSQYKKIEKKTTIERKKIKNVARFLCYGKWQLLKVL